MSETQFAYDVSISYSHADETWVQGTLLKFLEDNGLKVCIDFRDFQVGEPNIKAMERAVLTSRKTILVLTPAYLASNWTEFENLMLQTLDPINQQRRLTPLLKEKCDLPPRLGMLTYVDFVAPRDWNFAWNRLLSAIKSTAQPPVNVPPPPPQPAPTPATILKPTELSVRFISQNDTAPFSCRCFGSTQASRRIPLNSCHRLTTPRWTICVGTSNLFPCGPRVPITNARNALRMRWRVGDTRCWNPSRVIAMPRGYGNNLWMA